MTHDPKRPYNELLPLPPEDDLETKAVLRQCLSASRALAELKGAGGLIPDQSILINAIPLQEAKLSSEIENIVTTQDDLFHGTLNEHAVTDHHTKEVLRYRTALRTGSEALAERPLSLGMVEEVCSILRDQPMAFRTATEQVIVGNPRKGIVVYTPPQGGPVIQQHLANLEAYLLAPDGPDPLIRMAIAHYQFEAIHPFMDGNGRAGRILNILYLLHAGLLNIPVLYLSRFLIQNKRDYYRLLRRVTEKNEWEPWVLYMLQGIEETAHWTTGRIQAIRTLMDDTLHQCRTELPGHIYSKELIELIFRQPYCKIGFLVNAGIAKRQTASIYLKELETIGILTSETHGRERIYKHPALIHILTA